MLQIDNYRNSENNQKNLAINKKKAETLGIL